MQTSCLQIIAPLTLKGIACQGKTSLCMTLTWEWGAGGDPTGGREGEGGRGEGGGGGCRAP